MPISSNHGDGTAESADADRRRAEVVGVVAELTAVVAPPTSHTAVRERSASVFSPGGQCRHAGTGFGAAPDSSASSAQAFSVFPARMSLLFQALPGGGASETRIAVCAPSAVEGAFIVGPNVGAARAHGGSRGRACVEIWCTIEAVCPSVAPTAFSAASGPIGSADSEIPLLVAPVATSRAGPGTTHAINAPSCRTVCAQGAGCSRGGATGSHSVAALGGATRLIGIVDARGERPVAGCAVGRRVAAVAVPGRAPP